MHLLITEDTVMGPMSAHDMLELFKKDPQIFHSVMWISPEGMPPVLVVEWFNDFAEEGVLEDILSMDVPNDVPPHASAAQSGRRVDPPPDLGGLNPLQAARAARGRWREWAALLVLAFFGVVLLWVGMKVLRPARTLVRNDKPLAAKLLGSTPDALRNYQVLLESKISRDPQKYARALLVLQNDRALYPEGFLPSAELTAALALIHLQPEELDARDDWKKLLMRLPPEARQQGLAVVAYELSRVFAVRKALLPFAGRSQAKAATNKAVRESLAELAIILERIVRVVPASEPQEKVLHGMLLSRLLSLSLITMIEHSHAANAVSAFKDLVPKIGELQSFLSSADKDIIAELNQLASSKIAQPKAELTWDKSLSRLVELNKQNKFICQLNETGAGGDALLFLLSYAAAAKQPVPEASNVFDLCFVGLRLYPRLSVQSLTAGHPPVTEYATVGPLDEGLIRKYRKYYPTLNPALSRLDGKLNLAGEWMLVLYQNGILSGRLTGVSKKSQSKLCSKGMSGTSMCAQIRWTESSVRWRDLVPLVLEIRDDIQPQELALLGHSFIFHAARESLLSGGRSKSKEISEAMRAVRDLVDPEDPQIQFLLDYAQSLGIET